MRRLRFAAVACLLALVFMMVGRSRADAQSYWMTPATTQVSGYSPRPTGAADWCTVNVVVNGHSGGWDKQYIKAIFQVYMKFTYTKTFHWAYGHIDYPGNVNFVTDHVGTDQSSRDAGWLVPDADVTWYTNWTVGDYDFLAKFQTMYPNDSSSSGTWNSYTLTRVDFWYNCVAELHFIDDITGADTSMTSQIGTYSLGNTIYN